MKKVFLISNYDFTHTQLTRANKNTDWSLVPAPPIAILAIGSFLAFHNIPVELIDVNMDFGIGMNADAVQQVYQKVTRYLGNQAENIAWIGISLTSSFDTSLDLAREINKAFPNIPIILGGYQSSRMYRQILTDYPFITAIVRGDGEAAALQISQSLCQGRVLEQENITNLAWLDGNEIHTTPMQHMSPEELPILDYRLFRHLNCYTLVLMLTARGCPFHCNYCLESKMRHFSAYSPQWISQQLDHLEKVWPHNQILISNPIFGVGKDRSMEMCKVLGGRRFTYFLESRVDILTPDMIPHLKKAGVEMICLGLESTSPATLLRMNKVYTQEQAKRYSEQAKNLIRACFENDVTPKMPIMLSFPGDTKADYEESLRFLKQMTQLHDQVTARTGVKTGFHVPIYNTEIYAGSSLADRLALDFPQVSLSPEASPGTRRVLSSSLEIDPNTTLLFREQMEACMRLTELSRERNSRYYTNIKNLAEEKPEFLDDNEIYNFSAAIGSRSSTLQSKETTSAQVISRPADNADNVEKERRTKTKTLLHVGYAKAGSTFLQNWFVGHPQIQYARHGVGGFEKVYELIALAFENREQMPKYYVTSRETLGMAWFDKYSSGGMMLKRHYFYTGSQMVKHQANVCEILYNLFPDSKVIIVTRGYKGIIRSGYSEYVKIGGDLKFTEYLEKLKPYFEQWLDINYLVDLYTECFGKTNLIVLPYELIRDDPAGFFTYLEKELDVDHFEMKLKPVNRSRTPAELFWYAAISRFFIAPLAKKLNDRQANWLYDRYKFYFTKPNRLRRVIRVLDRLFDKKPDFFFPPDYLDAFKDKATVLKEYPFYTNYPGEYLLD